MKIWFYVSYPVVRLVWRGRWWTIWRLDDSSLVAVAKKLKIMISDKNAHSTDVFYRQRCYNEFPRDYKPAESNREDKYSI